MAPSGNRSIRDTLALAGDVVTLFLGAPFVIGAVIGVLVFLAQLPGPVVILAFLAAFGLAVMVLGSLRQRGEAKERPSRPAIVPATGDPSTGRLEMSLARQRDLVREHISELAQIGVTPAEQETPAAKEWPDAGRIAAAWSPERAVELFHVELRGPSGMRVVLQPPGPSWADLYLRLINLSPVWFEVERIHAELAIAHTPVEEKDAHDRYRIDPFTALPPFRYEFQGMHDKQVYVRFQIESGLATYLRQQIDRLATSYDVQLTISLYGQCETGRFEKTSLRFEIPSGAAGLMKQ